MAKRRPSDKPYKDFPLFRHQTGQWAKKVRGKLRYYGTDPHAALKKYQEDRDNDFRPRRHKADELTVADLVNNFLTLKRDQVNRGEVTARTWAEYHTACEAVVDGFTRDRLVIDLTAADFAGLKASAAKRLGPVSLGNFVQRVRTLFKFGYDASLLPAPVRFGPGFDKPPRRVVRLQRHLAGARVIDAAAVWRLIDGADVQLRAMILLGVNCGFGQGDCSELTRVALTGRPGWVNFPRPKTGIGRRAPLWPETVEALAAVEGVRPDPKDPADADRVFLTKFGQAWVRFSDPGPEKRGARSDAVGQEFAKLVKRAGVKMRGGFYTFRRVFRTVADGARDPVATNLIMGHDDDSMAGYYRELVEDDRLARVTDHVRAWLLAGKPAAG